MTKHHAGQGLHFEVVQGFFLLLREIADLGLGKFDVVEVAFAHLADRPFDFIGRQFKRSRRPVVEFLRQISHRGVLAGIDFAEDLIDGFSDPGVSGLDRRCVHSTLEVPGHYISPVFLALPLKGGECRRA